MNYVYGVEEFLDIGLVPALLTGLPSMFWKIAAYVLTSLTLYTVAERRGLKNPWMAWIPVLNLWILGSISDQYRYVVQGENRSKRKILLILRILATVCGMVIFCLGIAVAVGVVSSAMRNAPEEQLFGRLMGPAIGIFGVAVPLAGISIAYLVIRFMALYDIFMSMDPNNGVMFLVLSILFQVTEPFFLFLNRNKDLGVPPRKQQPVYHDPVYEQPKEEPWNRTEPDQM